LELYGVTGLLHRLIVSYLERQYQRVRLQSTHCNLNTFSNWGQISHGVPQGSNEFDPLILQDRFTEIFNILNSWFSTNLLPLYFSKTHYIKFSTKNLYDQFNRIIIASGNNNISESCYTKFLGINIVNTLSWKRHIDQLLPKLNTACYAIRTLKPYRS
jgi:hypothetical protein